MRTLLVSIVCLALPACTTMHADQSAERTPQGDPCKSDGLDAFVGRTATAELGAALLAKSGARTLRWAPPYSAMTMDFREDRLTVS